MGGKTLRTTVRLARQDLEFLSEIGYHHNHSEGVRFCIRFVRLYSLPAIKNIKEK